MITKVPQKGTSRNQAAKLYKLWEIKGFMLTKLLNILTIRIINPCKRLFNRLVSESILKFANSIWTEFSKGFFQCI